MDRREFLRLTGASASVGALTGCSIPLLGEDSARSGSPTSAPPTQQGDTSESDSAYDRKHDPLTTDRIDVGVRYSPHVGKWDCLDGEPANGPNQGVAEPATVNRHIDLLQGYGVNRLLFPVPPDQPLEPLEAFWRAELPETIGIELEYELTPAVDIGLDLGAELARLREQFDAGTYATMNGRPVVTLRGVDEFFEDDDHGRELRGNLPGDSASLVEFFEFVNTRLTVGGTEPYVVADLGPVRISQAREQYLRYPEAFERLDAVTNRYPVTTWDEMSRERPGVRIKRTYTALRLLQEETDVDVEPLVFPGFDYGIDRCEGEPNRLERSPEAFDDLLDVSGRYANAGRIRIDSFNNWSEGTQIEPGRHRGQDYGTAYVEAIERFVREGSLGHPTDRSTHYVAPDGADGNDGSPANPLATIQEGLARARPGETVEVRPGEYLDMLRTVRHGDLDAPITITGPKDAVLRPLEKSTMVRLAHDHVHLDGLTIDGLEAGGNPEDVESYAHQTIQCEPPGQVATYLEGLVIKPAAIGNARQALVKHSRSNDVEIGEFEVIGPAGLGHLLGGEEGHNGEIVYLGNATDQLHAEFYPWDTVDQSSGIHVHHIDNSAGHPHAEMVDVKAGVSDVLVEYCTDGGGSGRYTLPGAPPTSEAAFHLIGNETTLRWCVVTDGYGSAVEIAGGGADDPEEFEENEGFPLPDAVADSGRNNSVYGNRFVGNAGYAIRFPIEDGDIVDGFGPDAQGSICGNVYDGRTHADPGTACSGSIPRSETIGHLGGDSPWSE